MRLDDAFHVAIRMKTLFRAADDGRESDLRLLMSNVSRTERRGDRRWTKCGANETRIVTMSQCRFSAQQFANVLYSHDRVVDH